MTTGTQPDDPRAYVRLANLLRQQITNGTLRPGQPTPSITTLTQEHGIAGGTVDRAVDLLKAEGLVRTVPGRGIYVVPPDERPKP